MPDRDEKWRWRERDWLPSPEDLGFVASLMQRVTEPGKVAGWIAHPKSATTRRSTVNTCA
jgi:benzoyl-CoA 2,3-dioxygenase component B